MNIKKFEMQSYRDSIGGVVSSIKNLPYEDKTNVRYWINLEK